jgi:hypothetical protein
MLLPDFPVEFWSVKIFEAVANSVRRFIYFDERSLLLEQQMTCVGVG